MALINCKECGKEMSSEAKSCPHCGHPCKTVYVPPSTDTKGGGGAIVAVIGVLLIIVGIILGFDAGYNIGMG